MAKPIIPKLETTQLDYHVFGNPNPDNAWELYDIFHITLLEQIKHNYKLPIAPHRRSVNFLFMVTKGKAIRSKNLNSYLLKENDLYVVPAHQITSMQMISDDLEGFYCHFHPKIFNHPQLSVNMEVDFPIFDITADPSHQINNVDQVVDSFRSLYIEYSSKDLRRENILALRLVTLLNLIQFEHKERQHSPNNAAFAITSKYKNLISTSVKDLRRVGDCAQVLGISQNHLNKCVKEVTGKSALELLQEMRILESKVLLHQSNLSVSDIAFQLGGYEVGDFGRFFKKHTGMTPRSYRNQFS